MKVILWNLRKSLLELFPTTKYRMILVGLILIAAFISVSELLVAKLFTQIILNEEELLLNNSFASLDKNDASMAIKIKKRSSLIPTWEPKEKLIPKTNKDSSQP